MGACTRFDHGPVFQRYVKRGILLVYIPLEGYRIKESDIGLRRPHLNVPLASQSVICMRSPWIINHHKYHHAPGAVRAIHEPRLCSPGMEKIRNRFAFFVTLENDINQSSVAFGARAITALTDRQ